MPPAYRPFIRRCYRDARRGIKSEADLLRGALRRLRVRAADRTIVLTADQTMQQMSPAGPMAIAARDPGIRMTVRAEAFKAWFK